MNPPKIPDYSLGELIGEGSTGTVWVGRYQDNGELAVKTFKGLAINRQVLSDALVKIYNAPPHPGIVPIRDFDLASPQAYVAMDLYAEEAKHADGRASLRSLNLDSILGAVPQEAGWRLALQIADAMSFLHRKRIVHCNLKPSNVLLEDGETPRVKVADFAQGMLGGIEQIEPGESLFHAPPEQLRDPDHFFEGRAEKWDVYSFGVTVFRLLTGRFPRLHDAIAELRQRKTKELDLHQSIRPEQVAAALEKEAEIHWPGEPGSEIEAEYRRIVDTCLRLDPDQRYVDMREVLETLRQVEAEIEHSAEVQGLESEQQVLATRANRARRRAVVFGLGAAAAAGVAAYALYEKFANPGEADPTPPPSAAAPAPAPGGEVEPLPEASDELEEAQAKLASAIDDLRHSQSALDEVFEMIAARDAEGRALYAIPEGTLGAVLNYYDEFVKRHRDEPEMGEQVARALNNSGELNMLLGEHLAARTNLRGAAALLDSLEAGGGDHADILMRKARVFQNLSDAESASGYVRAAVDSAKRASGFFQQLSDRNPASPTATRLFASSSLQVGRKMASVGQTGESAIYIDRAVRLLEKLEADKQINESDLVLFAEAGFERGRIERSLGNREEAIQSQIETIDRYLALLEARPGIPHYRFGLAKAYGEAADLAALLGEPGEAQTANAEAANTLRELAEADPERDEYRFELARRLRATAQGLRDSGSATEARKEQEKALVLLEDLGKSHPDNPRYTYEHAIVCGIQGDLLGEAGKKEEAVDHGKQAVKLAQDLLVSDVDPEANNSKRPKYRHALAALYGKLGHHTEKAGDKDSAKHCFEKALKQYQTLASADETDETASKGIAWAQQRLERLQ